jgi:hypothetical protein
MVAFFVFLFVNVGNFVVSGWWLKPAIVLFVGFCAAMSWFTGGYVAVPPIREASQEGSNTGSQKSGSSQEDTGT